MDRGKGVEMGREGGKTDSRGGKRVEGGGRKGGEITEKENEREDDKRKRQK